MMLFKSVLMLVLATFLLLSFSVDSARLKREADVSAATSQPSEYPTVSPTVSPSYSRKPTRVPTRKPTHKPTASPTHKPTHKPTIATPPDHRKLLDVIIGFTTAVVLFSLGLLAFQNANAPPPRRQPTIAMSNLGSRRNDSGSFPGSYHSLDNSSSQEVPLVGARATAV